MQADEAFHDMQGGEDDLDALLAKFALEDKLQATPIAENSATAPSARVYSSFTPVTPNQVVHISLQCCTDLLTDEINAQI